MILRCESSYPIWTGVITLTWTWCMRYAGVPEQQQLTVVKQFRKLLLQHGQRMWEARKEAIERQPISIQQMTLQNPPHRHTLSTCTRPRKRQRMIFDFTDAAHNRTSNKRAKRTLTAPVMHTDRTVQPRIDHILNIRPQVVHRAVPNETGPTQAPPTLKAFMAHVKNKQKRKRNVQKSNNTSKNKKRNTPPHSTTSNATPSHSAECRYPLNATLEPGQKSSKCAYIAKRVSDRCGLTVQQALQLPFTNARGKKVKYRKADLYYDIRTKTLALADTHEHAQQGQRTHDDEPTDADEATAGPAMIPRHTPGSACVNVATAIIGPHIEHATTVTATAIPPQRPTSPQREKRIHVATEKHTHNRNLKRKSREAAVEKRQEKTRRTTYNTTLTNRETISIPDSERDNTTHPPPKQLE
jgi:hypothetical protein